MIEFINTYLNPSEHTKMLIDAAANLAESGLGNWWGASQHVPEVLEVASETPPATMILGGAVLATSSIATAGYLFNLKNIREKEAKLKASLGEKYFDMIKKNPAALAALIKNAHKDEIIKSLSLLPAGAKKAFSKQKKAMLNNFANWSPKDQIEFFEGLKIRSLNKLRNFVEKRLTAENYQVIKNDPRVLEFIKGFVDDEALCRKLNEMGTGFFTKLLLVGQDFFARASLLTKEQKLNFLGQFREPVKANRLSQ